MSLATALTATPALADPRAKAPSASAVPGEFVLPPAARAVPRATQILNAGTTGFLWAREGDDRLLWTDYSTGVAAPLARRLPAPVSYDIDNGYFREAASFQPGWYGAGTDTVAVYSAEPSPHVSLVRGSGPESIAEVPLPEGNSYRGTFGDSVLSRTGDEDGAQAYHLWRSKGGTVTETPVTGVPDDARDITVEDGDARSVILRYRPKGEGDGWGRWGMVDVATGTFTRLPDRVDGDDAGWEVSGFLLGADSVLRRRPGRYKADVFDRKDLSAAPRTVETGQFAYDAAYGIVGSTLLSVERASGGNDRYRGQPLWSLPTKVEDADITKVMDPAAFGIRQAPDGSVLVAGAEKYSWQGDLDWAVYRITEAADGSVKRQRVTAVDPMPAQIHGVTAGSGIVTTATNSDRFSPSGTLGAYRSTWLSTPMAGGTPTVVKTTVDGTVSGDDGWCGHGTQHCVRMFADGTGYHGREQGTESGLTMLYAADGSDEWGPTLDSGDDNPGLADLSGRFAVVDGASSGRQIIGEFRAGAQGQVLQRRDRVAAAVWGDTLWSGAASGGVVTATRLPAGAAGESFTTRTGCTPSDLQAVGRWVYWLCAETLGQAQTAGVYDRVSKRTVTAPKTQALLGDGYLAVGGPASFANEDLAVFDLHGGLPASGSLKDLPNRILVTKAQFGATGGQFAGPRSSWTVDRFGGGVVYADDQQQVHVVPTGVPTSALSVIDTTVASTVANWSGAWWLSKPAAAWRIDFRNLSGAIIRTVSGSGAHGLIRATWDGKDSAGRPVQDGAFTWTLTAQPADGHGAALSVASAPAAPLRATKAPSITGTVAVGSTVKAVAGTWSPAPASYAYRWAANGTAIKGATGASLPISAAVVGKRLTVTVTASLPGRPSGTATSAASKAVAKGSAPVAKKKPAITGTAKVGKTVKVSVGTWSPKVDSYRYEWRVNGVLIRGATGTSLKLTSAMRKKKVTVTVIARKAGYLDGKVTTKAVTVRR